MVEANNFRAVEAYIEGIERLTKQNPTKAAEAYIRRNDLTKCSDCIYARESLGEAGKCWESRALDFVEYMLNDNDMCFCGILQYLCGEDITPSVESSHNGYRTFRERFNDILIAAEEEYAKTEKPYSEEVELNSNGVNAKIKAVILSDKEMKEIGFTNRNEPYWFFDRLIMPKHDISFSVTIPKDGSDIRIDVLDEEFCQPYDYQAMLNRNPNHKLALEVRENVEYWMEYLQSRGVLKGHTKYAYI